MTPAKNCRRRRPKIFLRRPNIKFGLLNYPKRGDCQPKSKRGTDTNPAPASPHIFSLNKPQIKLYLPQNPAVNGRPTMEQMKRIELIRATLLDFIWLNRETKSKLCLLKRANT